MQQTLKRELAAARREGLITDWTQIKIAPLPDNQNAALTYQAAAQVYATLPAKQKEADQELLTAALKKGGDFASAAPILQHQEVLLRLAEKATTLPSYAMKRDWSNINELSYPEFGAVRQLIRLLSLRARLASAEGKPIDALKDVARAARVGVQIGTECGLQAALNRIKGSTKNTRGFWNISRSTACLAIRARDGAARSSKNARRATEQHFRGAGS